MHDNRALKCRGAEQKRAEVDMWLLLVLLYGILKCVREIVKKKSMEKSTVTEVLFFYTLIGFIMVLPGSRNASCVPARRLLLIAVKSFAVFLAWICSFHAIREMPASCTACWIFPG